MSGCCVAAYEVPREERAALKHFANIDGDDARIWLTLKEHSQFY
jgi:hypothetical protein